MTSVLYRADDDDFAEVVGPRWLHVAWREFAKKGDKNLACLVRPKAQPVAAPTNRPEKPGVCSTEGGLNENLMLGKHLAH